MSDQQQAEVGQGVIHIDHERLKQFLYDDRERCLIAFKAMNEIFFGNKSNAPEMREKMVEMVSSSAEKYRELILRHDDRAVQTLSLAFAEVILKQAGKKAPDFAVEAFEASLNTRSVEACEYAERIVHGYLSDAEKRGKLMAALSSEVMLNRSWERCRIYRRLATAALGYADSRETAVSVLGSVLSYRNAQPKERESALIKLWDQLLKGTDISVAEKDIVKVAANRNDLLFEAARGLLSDAKRLDFNRPEQKTLRMPIPAQVPLRLARSAATA